MSEKQVLPEFHLFPRLERIGKFVTNIFCMHQLASHGDHFEDTGGGPMLDRELYDQAELPFEDVG